MAVTFASALKYLVPSWLNHPALTALCVVLDDYSDRARQGLQARFPSMAGDDALALIGADRGLVRGLTETSKHYAARLQGWRYPRGHVVRGSAWALLTQVSNYFGAVYCWTIDMNLQKFTHSQAGAETYSIGNSWNWNGGLLGRFWVVLEATLGAPAMLPWASLGVASTWGGSLGLPNVAIGLQGFTPADAKLIRDLVNGSVPWKPAGTVAEWLIIKLDGTVLATTDPWVNWSQNVAGTQVATRYAGARYVSLNPANNLYAGNRSNLWPTLVTEPGGVGTYAGSAAGAWPALITEPQGTTYAGSAAGAWPVIDLVDDGDVTT